MPSANPSPEAAITAKDLTLVDRTPRVADTILAKSLGFTRIAKMRDLIRRNQAELETYGALPMVLSRPEHNSGILPRSGKNSETARRGRPTAPSFALNERQALIAACLADTKNAAGVRRALVESFTAFRQEIAASRKVAHKPTRAEVQIANRLRFWKIQFAQCAAALDELGADVKAVDMDVVLAFGRQLRAPALAERRA